MPRLYTPTLTSRISHRICTNYASGPERPWGSSCSICSILATPLSRTSPGSRTLTQFYRTFPSHFSAVIPPPGKSPLGNFLSGQSPPPENAPGQFPYPDILRFAPDMRHSCCLHWRIHDFNIEGREFFFSFWRAV